MDEAVNRYAREFVEAISAAVANDVAVQAIRARARASGYELKVTVEAILSPVDSRESPDHARAGVIPPPRRQLPAARFPGITAADRRFLRSLRISSDDATD